MVLGLIFGIWNSHTSLGNILGTLIAARFVNSNWGYSFMVPGIIIAGMGIVTYLFLVTNPEDVGLSLKKKDDVSLYPVLCINWTYSANSGNNWSLQPIFWHSG